MLIISIQIVMNNLKIYERFEKRKSVSNSADLAMHMY